MSDSNHQDATLRQHLDELLGGGGAHVKFDDVVKDIPPKVRGQKPANMPHSPWMLLEHLRLAQWDILEFSRNKDHQSPEWPTGYWPKNEGPPKADAWNRSIEGFHKDLDAMRKLVKDPKTDLYAKIPWGDGQTILREALLVADHNAYHVAQLLDVRRLLGIWKDE
jgi:DinB family protein